MTKTGAFDGNFRPRITSIPSFGWGWGDTTRLAPHHDTEDRGKEKEKRHMYFYATKQSLILEFSFKTILNNNNNNNSVLLQLNQTSIGYFKIFFFLRFLSRNFLLFIIKLDLESFIFVNISIED